VHAVGLGGDGFVPTPYTTSHTAANRRFHQRGVLVEG
jgi:hypothetical protein